MRIISQIKSFSHFKEIISYVDGITLNYKEFSLYDISFDYEEMIDIISYANKFNKEVFINLSVMFDNALINKLDLFINKIKDLNVYFIYFDIGVYNVLKKYNLEKKGVYDPKTLITNSKDFNLYSSLGIYALSLSLEMPLSDALKINSEKEGKIWYKVFGYHQMFYSRRKLISTYALYKNKDININTTNSYLKEETRDECYPILENEFGTVLFRPYVISMLKEKDNIKKFDYLYLDSYLIDEELYNEILKSYYLCLNDKLDLNESINLIDCKLNIKDGFLYEDTVYVKPEVKR